jgi:hypothetical protein
MPWTVGSGCCGIESRRLVGDASTQTALLSVEQRPARCLRNTAHQFLADRVKGEGLNKSHDGQPSGTSGFGPNNELDCPVPLLTLLFFGAAKDVPEAAKMVTAGTAFIPTCKPKAKRDTALGGATAPKEVNHQRNHCYD